MTTIESEKTEIQKPVAEVFGFLSNFNNFQKLMPPQVTNWSSTEEECTFTISGMATIGMKIVEKTPVTYLKITSNGKVPFSFFLHIKLEETGPAACRGQLVFEAELNPMLKMMAEKPLINFVNLLSGKLKDI